MADASGNPAANAYYSGRPLGLEHDPPQAQAVPAQPLQAQPQATAGDQANGLPAPQPQPQPRQDVGEQVSNHTHVHGVPGYYKGRLSNTNTAAAPLPAPAPVAPPAPPAPAVESERNLSWIDKWLVVWFLSQVSCASTAAETRGRSRVKTHLLGHVIDEVKRGCAYFDV